jgi:DNA-binding response OmpR family regulator
MKESRIVHAGKSASLPLRYKTNLHRRILVAEDDLVIRRLNTEVLIDYGYEVDAAEDGAVAWNALNTDNYDLLVTDYEMPKVSGVELLKKLYAARMAMPVIMVSGTIPTEELKRHPWLQIDAALPKPYVVAELLATVRNILFKNDSVHELIAPSSNWQSQPSAVGLRL